MVTGQFAHLHVAGEAVGEDRVVTGPSERRSESLLGYLHADLEVIRFEAEIACDAAAPGSFVDGVDADRGEGFSLRRLAEHRIFVTVRLHRHRCRYLRGRCPPSASLVDDRAGETLYPGGDTTGGIGVHELRQVLLQCGRATGFQDDDRAVRSVVECLGGAAESGAGGGQLTCRNPGQAAACVGAALGRAAGITEHANRRAHHLGPETLGERVDEQYDVSARYRLRRLGPQLLA